MTLCCTSSFAWPMWFFSRTPKKKEEKESGCGIQKFSNVLKLQVCTLQF
uniref:Uncharacterized protein n=1 Tax=Anguilla anguilla TaxID=7936 RepID=A0A0E9VGF2_ANGAN